jgi:Holliday junction DNA helicase RuvA
MIERLVGECVLKQAGGIVLDVHGVGYGVEMTEPAIARLPSGTVTIWVHTYVREEALRLFGFLTHDERLLFSLLLAVNGVGPRHALGVMGAVDGRQLLAAVDAQDASLLPKVPGVGPDLWKKILLGLKPKLKKHGNLSLFARAPAPSSIDGAGATAALPPSLLGDLRSALENFGYKEKELVPVLRKLERDPPTRDLGALIRLGLAALREGAADAGNVPRAATRDPSPLDEELF